MKHLAHKIIYAVVVAGVLFACKPNQKAPAADKGSIDPTKYVSIGNSITSGYADGALYYDGQMVSYPNLIAEQLKEIGGGEFKQPYFPMSSVGAGFANGGFIPNSKLILGTKTDCKGVSGLAPVFVASMGDIVGVTTNISAQGPFNNMGVPGAKSFHVPLVGNLNPFYTRMTSDFTKNSILTDAIAQNPTFFSVFIGNNDVLSYALAGGASDSITNQIIFNASIDVVVNAMTANGAKGIIGSIPDVTNIPYFTTIPYNGLTLDATSAAGLNATIGASLGIKFYEGPNAFLIRDATAPGGMRQIKSSELILLSTPQDSIKCWGYGSVSPLANKYVLTETEIAAIQTAIAGFNSKIKSTADSKGLAFVDVNAFMAQAKKGVAYNGINLNATFVSGGAFSLDGVHLTPRGNALLANEFIKAINSKYGSTIRQVDATKYNGVVFP